MPDGWTEPVTNNLLPLRAFQVYKWASYGLSLIAKHYKRWMVEAFEGLSGFCQVVDDIGIYDKDETSHINHVLQILQWCEERHIILMQQGVVHVQVELQTSHICRTRAIFRGVPDWFNYNRDHHKIFHAALMHRSVILFYINQLAIHKHKQNNCSVGATVSAAKYK